MSKEKLTKTLQVIYRENPQNFLVYIIETLNNIILKYPFNNKIYSISDMNYLNDLLMLRMLDTSFDKYMKNVIPLELYIRNLDDLHFFADKFNVLLLQFTNKPQLLSEAISKLHIYILNLQEEVHVRQKEQDYLELKDKLTTLV